MKKKSNSNKGFKSKSHHDHRKKKKNDPHNQLNLAIKYFQSGKLSEAKDCLEKLLKLIPENPIIWHTLGLIATQNNNFSLAIEHIQQAINLKPDYSAAYYHLGIIFKQQKKFAEAIDCYQKCLHFEPQNPDAYNNLGNILKDQGKFDQAIDCYQKALKLQPNYHDVYNNLGVAFKEQGKLAEAVTCYEKAIQLNPDYPNAYNNLGNAFKGQGKLEKAIVSYQKSIKLEPAHSDAHFHLSTALLLTQDFPKGWQEYEWRFSKTDPIPKPLLSSMWQGENLANKQLLLWSEQGLGDTIQFVRYALLLAQQGWKITIATHLLLVKLFQESLPSSIKIIKQAQDDLSRYSHHTSLMSLPRIFQTTLENIPTPIPYLKSPAIIPESLQLPTSSIPKIGIVWASNKSNLQLYKHKSIPLELFWRCYDQLVQSEKISLWSLQVGEDALAIQSQLNSNLIHNLSPLLKNFADTACIIEQLDLVITVDTAVAHLAGAMGKPVWVLLPFIPDWRWLLNRQDSPWYPTMRLFRQPVQGDWGSVIKQVKEQLYNLISFRIK